MSLKDRNFDGLADRFEQRIHNSRKGEIRQRVIWRDLVTECPEIENPSSPQRILDIGGGIGHFAIKLAQGGHQVTYNDISQDMTEKAQSIAQQHQVKTLIRWHQGPYQDLIHNKPSSVDLILCHALLEWLAQPELLLPALSPLLTQGGKLSLCFYNPAGLTFHNLLRGNFHAAEREHSAQSNDQGFTPNNPVKTDQVIDWLSALGFSIKCTSGIRVFTDYAPTVRGGLEKDDDVYRMELKYSQQEPYKWMARYIHILAQKL